MNHKLIENMSIQYKELLNNSEIKIFFFATPPTKSYLLVEKAIKKRCGRNFLAYSRIFSVYSPTEINNC